MGFSDLDVIISSLVTQLSHGFLNMGQTSEIKRMHTIKSEREKSKTLTIFSPRSAFVFLNQQRPFEIQVIVRCHFQRSLMMATQ